MKPRAGKPNLRREMMTDDPRNSESGQGTGAEAGPNEGPASGPDAGRHTPAGEDSARDSARDHAATPASSAKPYVDPAIHAAAANDRDADLVSDADPDADPDAPVLTDDQKRIVELEEEIGELKDRAMRALADADNAQKRAARDIADSRKYGATGLARDILTVADNLGRALQAVPTVSQDEDENLFNLRTGVDMTLNEMLQALERHGVQKVTPETGERFDHNRHQAMFEVPTEDLSPGSVAQVVQDGYVMHDRLLRPALVGVAKKPDDQGGSEEPPDSDAA